MKPAKILFFVDGHAPSPEDFAAAAKLQAAVSFRNARAVPSEQHSLEICDGVAGCVPEIYKKKYPSAEKAIKQKTDELQALTSRVGDSSAPKSKGQQQNAQQQKEAPEQTQEQDAQQQNQGGAGAWKANN